MGPRAYGEDDDETRQAAEEERAQLEAKQSRLEEEQGYIRHGWWSADHEHD